MHLVRDGRDVVRSILVRDTFTNKDLKTRYLAPRPNDPYHDKWSSMNRFERICWYWQNENNVISQSLNTVVRFEKLITSYDYLQENLLTKLHIDIPESVWKEEVNQPKNSTKGNRKAKHWKD